MQIKQIASDLEGSKMNYLSINKMNPGEKESTKSTNVEMTLTSPLLNNADKYAKFDPNCNG